MAEPITRAEYCRGLEEMTASTALWRAMPGGDTPVSREIAEWIGNLKLLKGLPFDYLVPDARMLPPESIRFFTLDRNWVDALADGALAVGRVTARDAAHDAAVGPRVAAAADATLVNDRRRRRGQPDLVLESVPAPTGFLLRSALVSGWPGLEVAAYADQECAQGVLMVRMDRLSPDILICLFADRFQVVNIHEPAEGVNFGATLKDPPGFVKTLRGMGFGKTPPGEEIPGSQIPVPLRDGGDRVVKVADLEATMVTKLDQLKEWDRNGKRPFTSAEFTLQLVQGADQQHFQNVTSEPPRASRAALRPRLEPEPDAVLRSFLIRI